MTFSNCSSLLSTYCEYTIIIVVKINMSSSCALDLMYVGIE